MDKLLIILCAYAQQGYAFGHISLCMYVCVCVYVCIMWQKNCLFELLPLENLPLA